MSEGARPATRASALAFAFGHAATAALVFAGVFMGLPSRWAPVDVPALVLVGLHVCAAIALAVGRAPLVARATAWVSLVVGLSLVAVLAWTAAYLSTIYGPVGRGGALIMGLVIALAVPWLLALPAAELLWLGPSKSKKSAESAG